MERPDASSHPASLAAKLLLAQPRNRHSRDELHSCSRSANPFSIALRTCAPYPGSIAALPASAALPAPCRPSPPAPSSPAAKIPPPFAAVKARFSLTHRSFFLISCDVFNSCHPERATLRAKDLVFFGDQSITIAASSPIPVLALAP